MHICKRVLPKAVADYLSIVQPLLTMRHFTIFSISWARSTALEGSELGSEEIVED